MRCHIEDNEILSLSSYVLEKIMPSYGKDPSDTPFGKLKYLINSVSNHFESLEKYAKLKVENKFKVNRFNHLNGIITNDIILLGKCIKSIQDSLSEGGNVYKAFLSFPKCVDDIKKQIKENEKQLSY